MKTSGNMREKQKRIEKLFSQKSFNEIVEKKTKKMVKKVPKKIKKEINIITGFNKKKVREYLSRVILAVGTIGKRSESKRTIIDIEQIISIISVQRDPIERTSRIAKRINSRMYQCMDGFLFDTEWIQAEGPKGLYEKPVCAIDWDIEVEEELKPKNWGKAYPMVIKPKAWIEGEDQGGYLKLDSKLVLNRGIQAQSQDILNFCNGLQEVEWKISKRFSKKEMKKEIKGKYRRKSYGKNTSIELAEIETRKVKEIRNLIGEDSVWFPWSFDFRGRIYPRGYELNPQGDPYRKGMLIPQNKREKGIVKEFKDDIVAQWMCIDIANSAGLDKLTFKERIEWTLENVIKKNFNIEKMIIEEGNSMDNKWTFENTCKSLEEHMRTGVSNNVVRLDATNQALQMYAVLTADSQTANTCNVGGATEIQDAYEMLAEALNKILKTTLFNRTACKYCVMTTMYGKLIKREEIYAQAEKFKMNKLIKFMDGIGEDLFEDSINKALKKIAPRAMKMLKEILKLNQGKDSYFWVMPDGFKVKYDVKKKEKIEFETKDRNGRPIKVSWISKVYGGSKDSRGLAASIIHSIDAMAVRFVQKEANLKFFIPIHDEFGVMAEDATETVRAYKKFMANLVGQDLLGKIMTQINRQNNKKRREESLGEYYSRTRIVTEKGTLKKEDVMNSTYILG